MPSFTLTLLTAFCLVFVIEGLLYALFPDQLKRLMAMALSLPSQQLRVCGFIVAVMGTLMIYLLKNMAGS